ncbi:amino acid ABC transporter permease [Algihabitans albus]|uniref:amino acid ABC transporter permease n=1 Tax=Algihabitans albus TaxID=2164067 RepID=UPI000E5D7F9F|nr:ABC transporter permease subunit [Algihabitans albus]
MGKVFNNKDVRSWIFQSLLVGGLALLAVTAFRNARQALEERGISTGFGFLDEPSGFALSESIIPFDPGASVAQAFLAGLANTVYVSLSAIILATVLGVLIGLARMSRNRLLSVFAGLYVELFRNTPQLIQIIFWYTFIIMLPNIRNAFDFGGGFYLSNRGLALAWLADPTAGALAATALGVGFVTALILLCLPGRRRWRGKAIALCIALPLLLLAVSVALFGISRPELTGFNFTGGVVVSPEFLALFLGLGCYIASFIAEIVRAGLTSVDKGQIEAADTLGLPTGKVLLSVKIPQALRVIVPVAAAQYISLVKNSSLGVAIGYPELFNVSNSLATLTGQAIECVAIMGVLYLLTAIGMSALANGFNKMTMITER